MSAGVPAVPEVVPVAAAPVMPASLVSIADRARTWAEIEPRVQQIELLPENRSRRIVRVFVPVPPDMPIFIGQLASAPIKVGTPAVQWNSGEIVAI